ncbi:MAG: carboxypeptidase regulatory-like domain-containing protein, partial [Verrucomicrobiaceae bacterium]|nr:carboxypeptidase regulatory-like domain-containing protein [Verrucomicrobiaceae bacterium]
MKTTRSSPLAASLALIFSLFLPAGVRAGAIKYNLAPADMLWPNGRIPYVFKDDITEDERDIFRRCARAWQRFADLKFVVTTQSGIHQSPDGNFVEVQKNPISGANYAWIGRSGNIGFPVAKMQPMAINQWTDGIVVHEMGHMLGFIHEQQRYDRNTFVELLDDNRLPGTGVNWDIENAIVHTSYDFDSIMHYDNLQQKKWWLSDNYFTMRAKPPYEAQTGRMGRRIINFPGDQGTPIGNITALLSAGDRHTIKTVYGSSVLVKGKVKLANGYELRGVKVEILPNGPDEAHFTALLSETGERWMTTKEDGEFQFQGVPTGNYKLKATRSGYTFLAQEYSIYSGAPTTPGIYEQDFIVTNAADTLPPEVDFNSPPGGTVQQHYKGTNNVAAGYLSYIHGSVHDPADPEALNPGAYDVDRVEVALDSNERWWNWDAGELDPPGTAFSFDDHIALGNISGSSWIIAAAQKWPYAIPPGGLPNGAYHLQARARDLSGNYSEWGVKQANFTIDKDPPTVTVDWVQGGDPMLWVDMFDFEKGALGGTFVETGDPNPKAYFTIKGFNVGLVDVVYWQGAGWGPTESASGGRFPVKIEGGRWVPADKTLLPSRSALKERDAYDVTIVAEDRAGHVSTAERGHFRLTPTDTSVPLAAFSPSHHEAVYTEHAMPVITGTASDAESYIQGARIFLRRLVPNSGGDRLYWNGSAWHTSEAVLSADFAPVPGNETSYTWSAPGADSALPSGADLPDGSYEIQVTIFNRESPQATVAISETFNVAVDPPRVAVTSVTHNGWAKAGWTLAGTVTDTAGVTFSNSFNRVTLTINRDGQYWDGNSWESSQQTVYANILPDNTWTYPGTTPDAQMPTGDGSYSVSAHVRDNNGNVNAIIAGGLPGNNQVIFTVDATPPQLTLASPAPGTTVNSSPLPAGWINGTSFDSSGPVTVTFRLKRLPSVVFTDYFWNGEIWKDSPASSTPLELDLNGTFPADNGPTSWKFTGHQPRPGWDFPHCLINGAYEVVAVAKDLAGNETTLTRPFTVDYNPQYIPPAFENMPTQPLQTPVFPTSALGGNNASSFNPLQPVD